jgi:hypothetical protein
MLDILAWAFVAWLFYRMIVSWLELKELERNVENAAELMEEYSKNVIVVFERVRHNEEDVILCYDTQNNFIAQGASKDEVVKLAQKRFPNKNIATYKKEELQWINPESNNNSKNG